MHNINNNNNNNNVVQSTNTTTQTAATTRVNTTQACAACKYQRRKCAPDCILAPYFPHDRQRQFLNAHKLFGVSNITKIIRHLDQPEKDAAMRTIILQSDVRATDPVGGCYRIIRQLQRQIDYTKAELEFVLHQLALCRAAQAQVQDHQQQQQQSVIVAPDDDNRDSSPADNSDVNNIFGMEALGLGSSNSGETVNYQPYFQPYNHNHHHLELQQYMMMINDQNNDNANAASTALQEAVTTANSWSAMMQSSTTTTKEPQQHSNNDIIQDRNDSNLVFKPLLFDGLSDDPEQDFRFESEPTIEQSEEHTSLRNHLVGFKAEDESSCHCSDAGDQHPHDLKGAATLFSLTKCNT
ncbi:OLC1v1015044C1 [Oldenlandia corymbosa var. corymbosa]|uniref:OLC1v1015044C1 n=1 Tax=Oldenlandia corymbosa var. corymbosa TaxID=529605 RepID=A0AAV1E2A5_OLDCO|nr:OLC1v1015044C1 [Oldenlandia corymbosa var. corymbosa]